MRSRFAKQLVQLNEDLLEMAMLVEDGITKTAYAFKRNDKELASQVIEGDNKINGKEKDIENICLKLLLQQQPVASDLRLISAALKMITDLERIGDQSADICDLLLYMKDEKIESIFEPMLQMATATSKMVTNSINSYIEKDTKKAVAVIKSDYVVDGIFSDIKDELMNIIKNDLTGSGQALDYLMIAKYFERIGDHAVNIAKRVICSLTGEAV